MTGGARIMAGTWATGGAKATAWASATAGASMTTGAIFIRIATAKTTTTTSTTTSFPSFTTTKPITIIWTVTSYTSFGSTLTISTPIIMKTRSGSGAAPLPDGFHGFTTTALLCENDWDFLLLVLSLGLRRPHFCVKMVVSKVQAV